MLSNLQLRSSSFLEFTLVAVEEGTFEGDAAFSQELKFGVIDGAKRLWRAELSIEVKSSEERPFAYKGRVRAMAVIEVHPKFPAEQIARAVELHGATLIYGVIREMVATVSSRSSKGLFLLPTLNFSAILNEERKETQSLRPRKKVTKMKSKSAH